MRLLWASQASAAPCFLWTVSVSFSHRGVAGHDLSICEFLKILNCTDPFDGSVSASFPSSNDIEDKCNDKGYERDINYNVKKVVEHDSCKSGLAAFT